MEGKRKARVQWLPWTEAGDPWRNPEWYVAASLSVLLDIREDIQAIRARLDCGETISLPRNLRATLENVRRLDRRMAKKVKLP